MTEIENQLFEVDGEDCKSYQGGKYRVVHCVGAVKSYYSALESVQAGRKRASFTTQMLSQIKRLADGQRMSKDSFPAEGDLPGKATASRFNALKRLPIRGYCWKSDKYENTYFISHYVHKDYKKLKQTDIDKVHNNWYRIEEGEDEY